MGGWHIIHFQWIDCVIIGVIVLSTAISLMRGFVRESISLLTWIVAFWVAFHFNSQIDILLTNHIHSNVFRAAASFGGLFVGTLIVGGLANSFISLMVVRTGLSGTDRSIGMIFGLMRGILLISVLLLLAASFNCTESEWWKESMFVPYFQAPIVWLREFLPEKFGQLSNF